MRILSGKFKGKSISFIKSTITRPLKDSVKENIFNIINHSNLLSISLEKSNVLDLFSGIGSFGLECLSRGAGNVTFVEKDKSAIDVLNKNLLDLSIQKKAVVVSEKISNFLKKKQVKKFEIIFLDPPFVDNTYMDDLRMISKNKIFKKEHVVIIHRETHSLDNLDEIIQSLIIKKYGRSKIVFGKFLS